MRFSKIKMDWLSGRRFEAVVWAGAGLAIMIPALLVLAYQTRYQNQIYPGISVVGLEMGGMSRDQAGAALEAAFGRFVNDNVAGRQSDPLIVKVAGDRYEIEIKKLDIKLNFEGTVEQAWQVGRGATTGENIRLQWQALRRGVRLKPQMSLNELELEAQVASIAAAVYQPVVEPSVSLTQTGRIVVKQGQAGREINQRRLISQVKRAVSQLQPQVIMVGVIDRDPRVSQEKLAEVKKRAEALAGSTLRIKAGDLTTTLTPVELISFLGFEEEVDNRKVEEYVVGLAKSVGREPQNAVFQFVNDRVTEFKPGVNGQTLKVEESTAKLVEAIADLPGDERGEEAAVVELVVTTEEPEITIDKANDLGINTQIGLGESYFSHSIPGRIHNLTLATSRISGFLVKPGEEFSFNRTVGDISAATGYQSAYIIKDGRTILGDGGGVCQVSTTLFRAVLSAGLDITERHPHSYRVSYYEQKSPVGIDATVYAPSVDFKFVNDTPGYILIQGYVEPRDAHMVFEIYGTDDGRVAEIGRTRLWDQVPPPPDLYQDDPTLPPGVVKQVDWKAWGAKAAFDWTVTRDGEILHRQTFYSRYRPWQAVFLRGI